MNTPVMINNLGEILQSVLIKGDLAKLTPQERVNYSNAVCRSIGLNPLTQPFDYIWLNGKLTLYARKDCTEQLRKLCGVSIEIVDRKVVEDVLVVHVRARDRDGRQDEDIGAVPFHPQLKGEARSNAVMKALTKAKRRVTLSICGLGFLDESEIDSIPTAALRAPEEHNGHRPAPVQPARQDQGDFPGDRPPEEGLPQVDRKRKDG
jgi:hypothetical protein